MRAGPSIDASTCACTRGRSTKASGTYARSARADAMKRSGTVFAESTSSATTSLPSAVLRRRDASTVRPDTRSARDRVPDLLLDQMRARSPPEVRGARAVPALEERELGEADLVRDHPMKEEGGEGQDAPTVLICRAEHEDVAVGEDRRQREHAAHGTERRAHPKLRVRRAAVALVVRGHHAHERIPRQQREPREEILEHASWRPCTRRRVRCPHSRSSRSPSVEAEPANPGHPFLRPRCLRWDPLHEPRSTRVPWQTRRPFRTRTIARD